MKKLTIFPAMNNNSAPGPHDIHNYMLQHLPPEGLDIFLNKHNIIWQQGYFHGKWVIPTLIPIPKPRKYTTSLKLPPDWQDKCSMQKYGPKRNYVITAMRRKS